MTSVQLFFSHFPLTRSLAYIKSQLEVVELKFLALSSYFFNGRPTTLFDLTMKTHLSFYLFYAYQDGVIDCKCDIQKNVCHFPLVGGGRFESYVNS